MEQSSGLQAVPLDDGMLRKRSVGTVEIQDDQGRRKTVQLDELNEADRALAEQFGYKPVSADWSLRSEKSSLQSFRSSNASSATFPPSLLLSVSRVSSPRSRQPSLTHFTPVDLRLQFGAG